jgi:hypothetical protein
MKTNITTKGQEITSFKRRTDKYPECSMELAAHIHKSLNNKNN